METVQHTKLRAKQLGRYPTQSIANMYLSSMPSRPLRSQHHWFYRSPIGLPTVPLTPWPPCHSLNRSFLSLADVLPAAPLAASFVSFSR
jgi:hypothetical protein